MAPITKSRSPTCPLSPIDPYEPLQREMLATWVTLEANNVPLNPPPTWQFLAKNTLSSDRLGPIEHLAWTPSPNLDL